MSSNTVSSNGHSTRKFVLPAFGARDATPGFGSENVVVTAAKGDCVIEATSQIVEQALAQLRRDGQAPMPVTTDNLHLSPMADSLAANLSSLWQADTELKSSERVLKLIESARQADSSEATARIREAIERCAANVIGEHVATIHQLTGCPLDRLQELGQELSRTLTRLKPKVEDSAGAMRTASLAIERVRECLSRSADFAESDVPVIHGQMCEWARTTVREAFRALVTEQLARELTAQWPKLLEAGSALVHMASEGLGRLDEIGREARSWEQVQGETLCHAPCNTILELPSTATDEALTGLLERHRFSTRTELVSYFVDRWLEAIRHHLAGRVDFNIQQAGTFRLLTAVPSATAFELFRVLVEQELRPDVMSVYGRLKAFGLREALGIMIERSALTSDPGPRASTRFHLNAYRILIVSLPEATRPEDMATRRELLDQLQELGTIEVQDHPAAFDEIVVHHVAGGWIWQILPDNLHLRNQYVAADPHRPHLVGVLLASPKGEIIPTYRHGDSGDRDHV